MFKIFPVDPATKRPLIKAWDRLATEREQGDWPAYGIPTGDPNGIVVIDIDPRNGGLEAWRVLCDEILLPLTFTVETGGGGSHLYYKLPRPGMRGCKLEKFDFHGIDFQATGQYVIGPGSLHSSGKKYEISHDLPLADLPAEFIKMLDGPSEVSPWPQDRTIPPESEWPSVEKRLDRALKYVASIPGAISGQDGHGATLKVALALVKGFALPERLATKVLACQYNPRCVPRWSEAELAHKIESAARSTKVPLGYMLAKAPASSFEMLFEGTIING